MDYSEANQRLKVDIFDNQCASVGRLRPNESHTKDEAGHNTERAQLRQFLRCVELRLEKGESLLKRTKRTARLVYTSTSQIKVEIEFDWPSQLADLLSYENSLRSDHIRRTLQIVAQENQNETVAMKRLAEKGNEDAVAVKIITIVTLVYLPANAVAVGPKSSTL
jgi:hypothetical protein